jgi:hypothetical protein
MRRAWRTEAKNASTVWPESVRPEASVMVPEIMMGSRSRSRRWRAHGVDGRLGVQRVEDGFDEDQVRAASMSARVASP